MTEKLKSWVIGAALGGCIGLAAGYGVATVANNRASSAPKDVKTAWDAYVKAQKNYMAALTAERRSGQLSAISGQPAGANGQRAAFNNQPSAASGHPSPVSDHPSAVVGPKAGTWIAFDENVADFGTVDQGTESVKVFVYRNKGNQRLEIKNVSSTCGCTVGQPEPKELPPGGVGHVRVSFKSGAFSGPISKTLTVQSNDPTTPTLTLGVKANVRTLFTLEPRVVDFGDVERGKPAFKEVVIKLVTPETFQVQRIGTTHPELKADLMQQSAKGGERAIHLLFTMDSNGNFGPFAYAGRIYLARPQGGNQSSTDKNVRSTAAPLELIIPAKGVVAGPLRVKPDTVFFGSVKQGSTFKPQKLVLTSRNGKAVEVKSVETGFEGLKAAVKALKPGMEYEIELTDAAPPPPGFFQRTLHILTSDSDVPIEVKLSGVVMKAM